MQKNKDSQRREPICKKREIKFGKQEGSLP
jgi:hypothetical protein